MLSLERPSASSLRFVMDRNYCGAHCPSWICSSDQRLYVCHALANVSLKDVKCLAMTPPKLLYCCLLSFFCLFQLMMCTDTLIIHLSSTSSCLFSLVFSRVHSNLGHYFLLAVSTQLHFLPCLFRLSLSSPSILCTLFLKPILPFNYQFLTHLYKLIDCMTLTHVLFLTPFQTERVTVEVVAVAEVTIEVRILGTKIVWLITAF